MWPLSIRLVCGLTRGISSTSAVAASRVTSAIPLAVSYMYTKNCISLLSEWKKEWSKTEIHLPCISGWVIGAPPWVWSFRDRLWAASCVVGRWWTAAAICQSASVCRSEKKPREMEGWSKEKTSKIKQRYVLWTNFTALSTFLIELDVDSGVRVRCPRQIQ